MLATRANLDMNPGPLDGEQDFGCPFKTQDILSFYNMVVPN